MGRKASNHLRYVLGVVLRKVPLDHDIARYELLIGSASLCAPRLAVADLVIGQDVLSGPREAQPSASTA